jgi:predicted nucleotidyltransferase
MLREDEIGDLAERIVSRTQPETLILFGSYAKGTATINSDIDVLLVKDTDLPMARRADDVQPAVARSLVHVDVHVYTPEEVAEYGKDPTAFVSSVLRSGRVLYDRGGALTGSTVT